MHKVFKSFSKQKYFISDPIKQEFSGICRQRAANDFGTSWTKTCYSDMFGRPTSRE